jgi:hypothetical protein
MGQPNVVRGMEGLAAAIIDVSRDGLRTRRANDLRGVAGQDQSGGAVADANVGFCLDIDLMDVGHGME